MVVNVKVKVKAQFDARSRRVRRGGGGKKETKVDQFHIIYPHSWSSLKFEEKIRKNTENSEKYFGKFGKILSKIRKNTFKYPDPGRKITFSNYAGH